MTLRRWLWPPFMTLACSTPLSAQRPVTRHEAVEAALAHGATAMLAVTDTAVVFGELLAARAYPNPIVTAGYTKDSPQRHAALDLPLDFPWLRGPRIGAAEAQRTAAGYRFRSGLASAQFDAEVAYTRALTAQARARLTRRNADDADSLLTLARLRRDAGDASDLDVDLAIINAGQLANAALDDSLAALAALLELQRIMGLRADQPAISLADTLEQPDSGRTADVGVRTLSVAAAEADLETAERNLSLAQGSRFSAGSLTLGVDQQAPPTDQPGLLPAIGIALPLPLFNRNGGGVASARAARDRAALVVEIARRESAAAVARALRDRRAALARVARDRLLEGSAARVAQRSLVAYAEGAVALPIVLEAQRQAREAKLRLVDDLAAAVTADAALRLLATPAP